MNQTKLFDVITTLGIIALMAPFGMSQSSKMDPVTISHIGREVSIGALDDAAWQRAKRVDVGTYWSAEAAPPGRHFQVRMLWSATALYIRFDATQSEPLVVSDQPDLTKKVRGLWNRDVCEIFLAPDRNDRNKYFEFEISPIGEWIDLGIEVTDKERLTNWEYRSGMTSAARIEKDRVVMAIKIPFAALGRTPKAGDVWLGNLFRCVGKGETRGYLAWQPTRTATPNFHVPAAFGAFHFAE